MKTDDAIICDHHPCKKVILTTSDNCIMGNCRFHVRCWRDLYRAWCWKDLDWDPDILLEIEFLKQEGGGHA